MGFIIYQNQPPRLFNSQNWQCRGGQIVILGTNEEASLPRNPEPATLVSSGDRNNHPSDWT